jgi:hypothetical protein
VLQQTGHANTALPGMTSSPREPAAELGRSALASPDVANRRSVGRLAVAWGWPLRLIPQRWTWCSICGTQRRRQSLPIRLALRHKRESGSPDPSGPPDGLARASPSYGCEPESQHRVVLGAEPVVAADRPRASLFHGLEDRSRACRLLNSRRSATQKGAVTALRVSFRRQLSRCSVRPDSAASRLSWLLSVGRSAKKDSFYGGVHLSIH